MAKKKTDEEIMFPEVTVAGYKVKPWSFGMLFEISPMLDSVLSTLETKDIDVDSGFLSYTTIARLFAVASPQILDIIAITLDVDVNEVKNLSMEDGVKIAFTIYQQNSTVLKNVIRSLLVERKTKKVVEKETAKEKTT